MKKMLFVEKLMEKRKGTIHLSQRVNEVYKAHRRCAMHLHPQRVPVARCAATGGSGPACQHVTTPRDLQPRQPLPAHSVPLAQHRGRTLRQHHHGGAHLAACSSSSTRTGQGQAAAARRRTSVDITRCTQEEAHACPQFM